MRSRVTGPGVQVGQVSLVTPIRPGTRSVVNSYLNITEERSMTTAGFDQKRLGRLRDVLTRHVERGQVPGVVALVSRRGQTAVETIGTTAFDRDDPMRRDTIFRIASVTKPITAAAAMILVEECVLRLDDPVDGFLPELANRRVLRSLDSALDDTVPANRPITLLDLLTFRAGIGLVMAMPGTYTIQQVYEDAGITPGPGQPTLPADELMLRLQAMPLLHQPGEQWAYNDGSDILSVLIARASGQPLATFFQERIFDPLGMKDTGFTVPAAALDRLATAYETNWDTGERELFDPAGEASRFAQPPVFASGAGGLVSTVDDLHAFGQMMLNLGVHGGKRILSRASVALMTTDHLTPEQKAASTFYPGFFDNRGWGLGVSVFTRRDTLDTTPGRYGWDGGYGTTWYVDPAEGLVGIMLSQRLWDSPAEPPLHRDFWTATYQAFAG